VRDEKGKGEKKRKGGEGWKTKEGEEGGKERGGIKGRGRKDGWPLSEILNMPLSAINEGRRSVGLSLVKLLTMPVT